MQVGTKGVYSSKSESSSRLVVEEKPILGVNEEFNQYTAYYKQVIREKSKGSILIVEDDPMVSLLIESVIKRFGVNIRSFVAASEAEALSVLKYARCELLIADYFLEGIATGLDLCKKVRFLYPNVQCLMISGMAYSQYEEIAAGIEVQPEFMVKPVSVTSIEAYLTTFFERLIF